VSSALEWLVAGIAALGAGSVNAVAGGGTLITFPTLVALGLPSVTANVTNAVALCPGYFGGTLAQRRSLAGQRARVRRIAGAAAAGALLGSILLLVSSDELFSALVPFLILGATALLALQDRIRTWLGRVPPTPGAALVDPPALGVLVFVAGVYGGYFGAGLGIMLLAVLGVVLHEPLPRVNALKQVVSLIVNLVAAGLFVLSGKVAWGFAAAMAVGSLAGGQLGGALAERVRPAVLKALVVVVGLVVGVVYLVR